MFENKLLFFAMIGLIVTVIIDTSVIRINDIINNDSIPLQFRMLLFAVNSSVCLLLQFVIIRRVTNTLKKEQLGKRLRVRSFRIVSLACLFLLSSLVGLLVFQLYYYGYYDSAISISIIATSYASSGFFIGWLSFLFLTWYRSHRNLVVILYFISMSIIVLNFITASTITCLKLSVRPPHVVQYVGTTGDVAGGSFQILTDMAKGLSLLSFFSIWVTTAVLMSSYRDKLITSFKSWIILIILLVYFMVTNVYQFIMGNILFSYMENDPVTFSIIYGIFLSLSKPIGGIIFGLVFWNISKIISYERTIKSAMTIAGWGILLVFTTNQAGSQIIGPYPPFGLTTITVLNLAGYLMLLGIFNAATLVSMNNQLRKFIHKAALESKLLGVIGQAEMETELQKTVKRIAKDEVELEIETEQPLELDQLALKKYVGMVIKEVKKENPI